MFLSDRERPQLTTVCYVFNKEGEEQFIDLVCLRFFCIVFVFLFFFFFFNILEGVQQFGYKKLINQKTITFLLGFFCLLACFVL